MKRKNKKLIVIVCCLLLVISVSLAYYIGQILINGEGATGNATTAKIKGATIKVEGVLEFNDPDILPGHKSISSIKVTAIGNNELIPYNLIWKGTNGISKINYTVYKTSSEMNVSASCEKKTSVQNGVQILNEECTITNLDNLGSEIASGSIVKNSTKEILAKDEFITAISGGQIVYYYVVLEYPNLDEDQSSDMNAAFEGKVTVEESQSLTDMSIMAVYIEQEDGEYNQEEDIPQSGYVLSSEKSTCTNGTIPEWDYDRNGLLATNLTKSGTRCYLYFNRLKTASETILSNIESKTETPDFSQAATTDEGIYEVSDGMYGGTSYYWRGAATTNYVKFAGFCWRIIRINGDKTMRLIYDGTTCHANGTSTTNSIAVISTKYNPNYNKSEYVGWKYTIGVQRPSSITSGTNAPIKTALENWYNSNIGNNTTYASKVADGKYCNDRNLKSGSTWSSAPSNTFYYAAYERNRENYQPSLSCAMLDTYILKVGLITADEVTYAGGKNANNTSYYLYNGQNYWTMSPSGWSGGYACAFAVSTSGYISDWYVNNTSLGVRPVINLKADTLFASGGTGTLDNPYVVQ